MKTSQFRGRIIPQIRGGGEAGSTADFKTFPARQAVTGLHHRHDITQAVATAGGCIGAYAYWRAQPSHYHVRMRGDDDNGFLIVENDGLEYKVRRVG